MSYLAFAREMLGNLFKPPATVEYPLKPKTFPEINRGKVVNSIDDCIFCGMCMRVCPSAAITVDRGARTWSINRFACVQCKGCVDHCPKKCLRMDVQYTEPAREKTSEVLQGKPLPPPVPGKEIPGHVAGAAAVASARTAGFGAQVNNVSAAAAAAPKEKTTDREGLSHA